MINHILINIITSIYSAESYDPDEDIGAIFCSSGTTGPSKCKFNSLENRNGFLFNISFEQVYAFHMRVTH